VLSKKEQNLIDSVRDGKFIGLCGNNWVLAEKCRHPFSKKEVVKIEAYLNVKLCNKLLSSKKIYKSESFFISGVEYDRYLINED
jgi:hypothetical protein